jgi:hypothetical protein
LVSTGCIYIGDNIGRSRCATIRYPEEIKSIAATGTGEINEFCNSCAKLGIIPTNGECIPCGGIAKAPNKEAFAITAAD